MFKSYLQYLPKTIQLSIFICLWASGLAILAALQPVIIQQLTDLPPDALHVFFEDGLTKFPTAYFILNFVSSFIMFALPALVFAYLANPSPLQYLRIKPLHSGKHTFLVVVLAVVLIPLMSSLSGIIKSIDLGNRANDMQASRDAAINLYLQSGNVLNVLKNVLLMALVPALFEEIFFRGVLQKFVYSFIPKKWVTFLIVGIIFALFHGSIYELLPILLGSIVLSWVYHHTSNLSLCILLHFLNNGIQVVLASTAKEMNDATTLSENIGILSGIFIASLATSIFIMYKVYQSKHSLPPNWNVHIIKSN